MREILFRGKRTDSGEWVYGFYFRELGNFIKEIPSCVSTSSHLVHAATIGQYTGIKDQKGVKIFEGDIVKTKKYGKIIGHANVNYFDIFVVKYTPCTFRLENKNRGFNLVDDGYSKIEVIGNIHDNPELLEGGTERAD